MHDQHWPVRNDSGVPAAWAEAYLARYGVEIQYGEFLMRVGAERVDEARRLVLGTPGHERRPILKSITSALDVNLPLLIAGALPKAECDATADDLVLWYVLQESQP